MRPLLLALLAASSAAAQSPLHQRLADIARDARGKVYVSCSLPGVKLDCDLDPHGHPPMQSVFKFPLAIAVLQQVQAGKLALDQKVRFLPSDLSQGTYSPLQDAHPQGGVDVPLRELLQLSVSKSDNTATDIMLRIIGGPKVVQRSLDSLGFPNIHVQDSEHSMHLDSSAQYRNYAEPAEMVGLLRRLVDRSPLNAELTAFLLRTMTEATSGPKRLHGLLPAGTPVAHKTGTSGTDSHGMSAATNDVGLIKLPDGRQLAVAIFVGDSPADEATREGVIARIARAAYDEALTKH